MLYLVSNDPSIGSKGVHHEVSHLARPLISIATACDQLHAQIKLPIFEEDNGKLQRVVFQEAGERSDFQHGKLLRITLNGDKEALINGILVRIDQKNKRIYLRTEPGMPPKMITLAEIKSVDKGVIREVNFKGDVSVPEILRLEIFNGSRRTVSFNAPTLSPEETNQLLELEQAENELARLENFANAERQDVLTNRMGALQIERQQLLNDLLRQQLTTSTYYVNPIYTASRPGIMPLSFPLEFLLDSLTSRPPLSTLSTPPVQDSVVVTAKTEFAGTLSAARHNLALLRSRAVYEKGQLVAVVSDYRNK